MANKIKPKRSYTANSVPLTTDLEQHELAINWADGKAFTKNASGQIVSVTLGGSGGGGLTWSTVPASATAAGTAGQIAYDGDYVYVATAANTWKRAALATWTNFTPASLTGLQLWLDASDASTLYDATSGGSLVAADGAVARWEDKSGNARHATQGTSANRPARKTAIQGGKDVLRFDGSNDFLSLPSSTATFKFLHSSDHTIFVVFENTNDSYAALVSTSTGSSLSAGALLYAESNTVVNQVYRNVDGSFVITNASGQNFLPLGFTVLSLVAKPTDGTAANRSAIRKNGGSPVANNSDTAAVNTGNATSDLRIGAADGAGFVNGDIAEVIIYDTALSDADREAVENYLLAKWGIT